MIMRCVGDDRKKQVPDVGDRDEVSQSGKGGGGLYKCRNRTVCGELRIERLLLRIREAPMVRSHAEANLIT